MLASQNSRKVLGLKAYSFEPLTLIENSLRGTGVYSTAGSSLRSRLALSMFSFALSIPLEITTVFFFCCFFFVFSSICLRRLSVSSCFKSFWLFIVVGSKRWTICNGRFSFVIFFTMPSSDNSSSCLCFSEFCSATFGFSSSSALNISLSVACLKEVDSFSTSMSSLNLFVSLKRGSL